MLPDLTPALAAAVDAAHAAGALLRAELLRPDGPRGPRGKCPADDEAELLLRKRLLAATPNWGFLGEETGRSGVGPTWWVIDPNDGTSAMQDGGRGASVSLAVVHDGVPVLGVVYTYAPPLGGSELFTWAQGVAPCGATACPCTAPGPLPSVRSTPFSSARPPTAEAPPTRPSAPPLDFAPW